MATQSNEIVPMKDAVNTVRVLLDKSKQQFAMALPRHLKVDQFMRVAMTTIQKNPDLLKCTQTSLIGCLMESAQLGLQVDGLLGEAYLVPFNNKQKDGTWKKECQLIVGYRGFMKLGRNSGEVSTFKARCVYKSDHLVIKDGLDPVLEHTRSETNPVAEGEKIEDAVRGAYALVKMKDGSTNFVFLWKWEIERARAHSKMSEGKTWITNYPEMAEKTAMRRLAKYMPQSPEIQRAAALDEAADAGISQEIGSVIEISAEQPAQIENGSKLDAVVDASKAAGLRRSASIPSEPSQPQQESGKAKGRAATPASPQANKPTGNPNYAEGSDPDPMLEGNLFEREPGSEG